MIGPVYRLKTSAVNRQSMAGCVRTRESELSHLATTEQMKVEMEDGLAAQLSNIRPQAIAIAGDALVTSDLGRHQYKPANERGITRTQIIDRCYVLSRYDQNMHRRGRGYVAKRNELFILIYLRAGDVAANDTTEDAIWINQHNRLHYRPVEPNDN